MNNAGETHKASVVPMVRCKVFSDCKKSGCHCTDNGAQQRTNHHLDAGAVKLKTMAKRLARSILHFFERLAEMKRKKKITRKIWIQLMRVAWKIWDLRFYRSIRRRTCAQRACDLLCPVFFLNEFLSNGKKRMCRFATVSSRFRSLNCSFWSPYCAVCGYSMTMRQNPIHIFAFQCYFASHIETCICFGHSYTYRSLFFFSAFKFGRENISISSVVTAENGSVFSKRVRTWKWSIWAGAVQ